jgi:hypothetical protein
VVQLTTESRPKPVVTVTGILFGLVSLAIGVGLLLRSETGFGAVGSAFFVVGGLFFLSAATLRLVLAAEVAAPAARDVEWDGESVRFFPRRDPRIVGALVMFVPLGLWLAALGVVGGLEETWLWPVLAILPAIYVLGSPVCIGLGRIRAGGVWLTPTRLVHESFGVRSTIELVAIQSVTPMSREEVYLIPTETSALNHKQLAPRLWCANQRRNALVIPTVGIAGGAEGLAAGIRERVAAAQDR